MSSSLKGLTVLASFAVQPVTRETESERYFENHYSIIRILLISFNNIENQQIRVI